MSKTNSNLTNTTQLSQKIIFLKSEVAKYKAMVEEYENNYHYSQLRKLKLQNQELREEKETISLQLQEMYTKQRKVEKDLQHQFQIKSEKLNQSLITQNEKIEILINVNQNYQKEISSLKEKLEDYIKNNEKMKLEMTSLNEHLNEKNAELVQIKDNHQQLLIENSKRKEIITDFQNTNESLLIDIENLSKENDQYKKEMTELRNVTTTIKEDKCKIEEILQTQEEQNKVELSKLQKELFLYKNLTENLKNDNNYLVEEINIYKGKLEEIEKNLTTTNEKHQVESSQSKKQLDGLQMELKDVKKKYSDLEQENKTLKSSKIDFEQNVKEYRKQNEYLMEKTEILNVKNDENFSSLIKMNQELLSQNENILNFQQQLVTTVNLLKEDFGSIFSMVNYDDREDYEISELLVSILDHQFKKALENSLDVEDEDNLIFISLQELESKLEELSKEIESTSNNNISTELD